MIENNYFLISFYSIIKNFQNFMCKIRIYEKNVFYSLIGYLVSGEPTTGLTLDNGSLFSD